MKDAVVLLHLASGPKPRAECKLIAGVSGWYGDHYFEWYLKNGMVREYEEEGQTMWALTDQARPYLESWGAKNEVTAKTLKRRLRVVKGLEQAVTEGLDKSTLAMIDKIKKAKGTPKNLAQLSVVTRAIATQIEGFEDRYNPFDIPEGEKADRYQEVSEYLESAKEQLETAADNLENAAEVA